MSDLKNEAKGILDETREKLNPIWEDVKEKAAPVVEDIREKTDPLADEIREKAAALKQKADPMITRARDIAGDAIDAVKQGAEKIGDLFEQKGPGIHVKNELFSQLDEQVQAQKAAAMDQASEMQRRLEELMGGKKTETTDDQTEE